MEKKTCIIIISILLALSIMLNITFLYTVSYLDMEWENAYEKNDIEWCEMTNEGNVVMNDLIDDLKYYDEEYSDMPYMKWLDCWK